MSSIILYFQPFLITFIFSLVLTKALILFSRKYNNCHFEPDRVRNLNACKWLKLQISRFTRNDKIAFYNNSQKNITRFGGVAIITSFLLTIFLSGDLVFDNLKWGIVISSVIILFFGLYDDFKNLSWKQQLFGQVVVVLVMIYAGLQVDYIANPFSGPEFRLDVFQYSIFNIQYSILGSLFILFWIIGFMNVMNWLDGLDGLAGGVAFIGMVTLFFLSISGLVNQPPLGIISITVAGAILGFLVFNFNLAKIFMGTSGSMFLGFILAVLAIFSGGKIATALLVMGFPILDAFWVIAQRIKAGKSPFEGDTRHLHYKLLERGWSQKKVVLFIYFICLIFGVSAILFQSLGKFVVLLFLFVFSYFILTRVLREKV
ncbi:MAG: MraY family glycosyltransferase [Patescibacteria group bacterium]|nr:MraY family glycosyltransferase [Patescibacteria group bacterium]